jgi:Rieske Fe-S protein
MRDDQTTCASSDIFWRKNKKNKLNLNEPFEPINSYGNIDDNIKWYKLIKPKLWKTVEGKWNMNYLFVCSCHGSNFCNPSTWEVGAKGQ